MSATPVWLRAIDGGVAIDLLVQPRASRSRIVGEHDGRLKVQLAAPPVDGEANAELVRLLASLLDVRKGDVAILHGETGRRKTVRVEGVALETAAAVLGATG